MDDNEPSNKFIDPRAEATDHVEEGDTELFNKLSNDPELTPEKVAEALNVYATALQKEFEEKTQAEPENVAQYTKEFFKRNVHGAAAQIVWLSTFAESETVKLSASKYVVEQAIKDEEDAQDPVRDLLTKLKANDGNKKIKEPS